MCLYVSASIQSKQTNNNNINNVGIDISVCLNTKQNKNKKGTCPTRSTDTEESSRLPRSVLALALQKLYSRTESTCPVVGCTSSGSNRGLGFSWSLSEAAAFFVAAQPAFPFLNGAAAQPSFDTARISTEILLFFPSFTNSSPVHAAGVFSMQLAECVSANNNNNHQPQKNEDSPQHTPLRIARAPLLAHVPRERAARQRRRKVLRGRSHDATRRRREGASGAISRRSRGGRRRAFRHGSHHKKKRLLVFGWRGTGAAWSHKSTIPSFYRRL